MYAFFNVEDILYVFEKWTLILRADLVKDLKCGMEVELLDGNKKSITQVVLGRCSHSRNQEFLAIETNATEQREILKKTRYVKRKQPHFGPN